MGTAAARRARLPIASLLAAAAVAAVLVPAPARAVPPTKPIQPGAEVQIGGAFCTLNFVFRSGSAYYIGTAGHCAASTGQRALAGSLDFGSVVFTRNDATLDFALIRIDAGDVDQMEPAVRQWGGPTGILGRTAGAQGDVVNFYGYGLVLGSLAQTRPRQGVLVSYGSTHYQMDAPAVNGDSGAPVLHAETGRALGIVSEYGFNETIPTTDYGPTMANIRDRLETAGYDLTLVTATYPG
jgi:hypothetical protein